MRKFPKMRRLWLVVSGDNAYSIAPSGRGTEVAIPAPTRNRLGALPPHVGSNPTLSAIQRVTLVFDTKHPSYLCTRRAPGTVLSSKRCVMTQCCDALCAPGCHVRGKRKRPKARCGIGAFEAIRPAGVGAAGTQEKCNPCLHPWFANSSNRLLLFFMALYSNP
jgi:hypothetical protein